MVSSLRARRSTFSGSAASYPVPSASHDSAATLTSPETSPVATATVDASDTHVMRRSWLQTTLTDAPPKNVFLLLKEEALLGRDADVAPRRADQQDVSISRPSYTTRHGPRPAARGARPRGLVDRARQTEDRLQARERRITKLMVRLERALGASINFPDHAGGVAHDQTIRGLVEGGRRERQARRRVFDVVVAAEPLARLGDEVAVAVREHRVACLQQRFWESSVVLSGKRSRGAAALQASVDAQRLGATFKPRRIDGQQAPSIPCFSLLCLISNIQIYL